LEAHLLPRANVLKVLVEREVSRKEGVKGNLARSDAEVPLQELLQASEYGPLPAYMLLGRVIKHWVFKRPSFLLALQGVNDVGLGLAGELLGLDLLVELIHECFVLSL